MKAWQAALVCCSLMAIAMPALSDSRETIDAQSREALQRLAAHSADAAGLVDRAVGVLVFPDLVKVGFGEGSQYGEGVLLVAGEPVGYFATAGAPFGLALSAGYKSQVILFMSEPAVAQFRNSHGWEVDVDSEVLLLTAESVGGGYNDQPVVGFIYTEKGLSDELTFSGGRITPIAR